MLYLPGTTMQQRKLPTVLSETKSGFVVEAEWTVTHCTSSVPTFVIHSEDHGAINYIK